MQHFVRCACGVHFVDPEYADNVHNGVPMCPPWTCQKVKEHNDAGHYRPALEDQHANETED